MKLKLLKSTLLLSLTTPAVAIASSCVNTSEVKTDVKTSTTENLVSQTNAVTKHTITFKLTSDQITKGATLTGPALVKARDNAKFSSVEQPIAYLDNRPQTYWLDEDDNKITDTTKITKDMVLHPYFQADISLANCVSVIALEHTLFNLVHHGTNQTTTKPNLLYSFDGLTWSDLTTSAISIPPGEAIYIRGTNDKFSRSAADYSSFIIAGTVHLNGSVMSLLDGGTATKTTIPSSYCFTKLFEKCSGIKVISSNFLPATTLTEHCYDSMFKGCTSLESFPSTLLPAGKLDESQQPVGALAEGCYENMFTNCTSLPTVSESLLPARTLASKCYYQMFRGCTGITSLTAGVLPATTLADNCYTGMFRGCSGLTSLPNNLLTATSTLADSCYYGMFADCTRLVDLSSFSLPATTLKDYCYREMFYNCTSLTDAPALAETTSTSVTLATWCYYGMFYNCKLLKAVPTMYNASDLQMYDSCYAYMFYNCATLTDAPALSSTKLAASCYRGMYYNCSAITTDSFALPATTLYANCYREMFYNCSALKSSAANPITISAQTLASYCCADMFNQCIAIEQTPVLSATVGYEGCYRSMFDGCTGLTGTSCIGKISLESTPTYACYMMFVDCSNIKVKSGSGTTFIFKTPSDISAENCVTAMFQGTIGYTTSGYPMSANTSYYLASE